MIVLAGVATVLVKAVRVSYGAGAGGHRAIIGIELTASTHTVPSDVFYISGNVGGLYPGAQSQLPLTVTNPMSVDITVTSLTVSPTGSDTIGCDGTSSQNIQVTDYSGPGFVVGHGGSAIVELPIGMPASAADACQEATFALSYGGSADAGAGWTKTITMGPSRMEGDLRISAGESIAAGYHLSARKPPRAGGNVSVTNAAITLPVTCADGSTPPGSPITIALSNMTYTTPAGTTMWIPSAHPASPGTYQGSTVAPDLCHGIGGGLMRNRAGAVLSTTISGTGGSISVQFHYRDPAAKGGPNANCSSTSQNPEPGIAGVCTGAWSGTRQL